MTHCECPIKGCICDKVKSRNNEPQCDNCVVGKHIGLSRSGGSDWFRFEFEEGSNANYI